MDPEGNQKLDFYNSENKHKRLNWRAILKIKIKQKIRKKKKSKKGHTNHQSLRNL